MLELLEQLYLHHISHINKYAVKQIALQNNQDLSIPTKQELSAYMSGQLSLFPKGSGMTLIQWQRDKVAFIELFVSVYESNSVKAINRPKITKKEFFGILSQLAEEVKEPKKEMKYLDVVSAAKILGLSRAQMYILMRDGKLPYTHVGRQRRLILSDLVSYVKKGY